MTELKQQLEALANGGETMPPEELLHRVRATLADGLSPRVSTPNRARGPRRVLAAAFVMLSIVLIASAVAVVRSSQGNDRSVAPRGAPQESLSVLERPIGARDGLPDGFQEVAAAAGVVPSGARLALDAEGVRVYVVRGSGGDVCAFGERESGAGGTCGQLSSIYERGALVSIGKSGDEPDYTMVGIVGDGTDSVTVDGREATLGDNAFAIHISSNGERHVVRIHSREGTKTLVVPPSPSAAGSDGTPSVPGQWTAADEEAFMSSFEQVNGGVLAGYDVGCALAIAEEHLIDFAEFDRLAAMTPSETLRAYFEACR